LKCPIYRERGVKVQAHQPATTQHHFCSLICEIGVICGRLFPLVLVAFFSTVQAGSVSFEKDVMPILNSYCVMCHLPGGAQGGLSLYPDAWSELVGVPSKQSPLLQVEPGSADRSYLYIKLIDSGESVGGSGLLMPIQQPPLDPGQIETIRLWIEQGAEQN
jgi:hypothetical protein